MSKVVKRWNGNILGKRTGLFLFYPVSPGHVDSRLDGYLIAIEAKEIGRSAQACAFHPPFSGDAERYVDRSLFCLREGQRVT